MSGTCMIRHDVVAVSGAEVVHSRQAWTTSLARSHPKSIMPPVTFGTGTSSISRPTIAAYEPPPPRSAQNRSGSLSRSARTSRPSAVTTSNDRTRSEARP